MQNEKGNTIQHTIDRKLFLTYRELTYQKLDQALQTVSTIRKRITADHIKEILERTEQWLKGEVAKQPEPVEGKLIIENAANMAVEVWLKVHGIRLSPKPKDVVQSVENMIQNVKVRPIK